MSPGTPRAKKGETALTGRRDRLFYRGRFQRFHASTEGRNAMRRLILKVLLAVANEVVTYLIDKYR